VTKKVPDCVNPGNLIAFIKMESALPQKKPLDWSKLINYRPTMVSDLDAIMEIENQSFRTPTRRETYEKELDYNFYLKRVAELKEDLTIAGYGFCLVTPPEASVMSIAVRPELRKKGLASHFLKKILDDLKALKVREVWLDVRPSNRAAQALYQGSGFHRAGVRAGYYSDSGEDALVMKKELA
jgi:[ribosomal protein S18]-alanine N-acetyltransferase